MPTIFSFTLSDRLTTAATRLGALQPDPKTATEYIEDTVKHVLRGQRAQLAAEEASAVLTAYDVATDETQRQVQNVLGIRR